MYLGKKKLLRPETYEQLRKETLVDKAGAVDIAFDELGGLINKSELADQYFGKTRGWLSQKLNGCTVCNTRKAFTEEEYRQLAEAFRHIALRLTAHADEIDSAPMDDDTTK